MKCLEKIISFIRIPYVVALEFSRHNRKLYKDRQLSIKNSISDNLTMIENHKKKVLNAIAVLEKRNFPEIDELLNSVGACYDKATSLLDDYFDEHSVLTLINDTWNSDLPEDFLDELQNNQQVMAPLELSEIYGICDDGEKRYKKENPPGYKDAKEKDGIRKYSDLIWWKEVIQYARKSRKNIVLVTDDVKEDWWKIDKKFVKYGSEVNWLRKLLSKLGKYAAGVWIYYTIVYSMYISQILSSLDGIIKSWVLLYLIGVAISFAGAWLHQKIARSNVNIEEQYEKGN